MPASARLALMSPRPRNPSRHLAKPPGASCLSLSLSSHNQSSKPQPFSVLSPVVHPPPSTTPPPTQPHAYKADDCPRTCTSSSSHLRPTHPRRERTTLSQQPCRKPTSAKGTSSAAHSAASQRIASAPHSPNAAHQRAPAGAANHPHIPQSAKICRTSYES